MLGEFESASGVVQWETNDAGIVLAYGKQRMKAGWSQITRAGLVEYPHQRMPENFPYAILPGLGKLVEVRDSLARDYVQLVLARGSSPFKAIRVPLPKKNRDAALLSEEVQRYLGERWAGELPLNRQTEALGFQNPGWFYVVFAAGLVIFGFLLFLAAGAYRAVFSGRLSEVPLIAWIALLLWALLAFWILARFSGFLRRR